MEISARPVAPRPRRVTNRLVVLTLAILGLTACSSHNSNRALPPSSHRPNASRKADPVIPSDPLTPAVLAPGSDPSVLPGPLLIADRGNNRLLIVNPSGSVLWQFPERGDLAPNQTFKIPDDAFFTPDGSQIITTQEDDFVISVVDIASHRIVYRYGTPGEHGSGPNQLWNPDDALMLRNGTILTADIKNCRLLMIGPGTAKPVRIIGQTTHTCHHAPPEQWGSPNGAFPMSNGHFLVTEINGDWVDEFDLRGTVLSSFHPPGVRYPSDSNEVSPGVYLTVDYSSPGKIETFDAQGRLLWRYRPTSGQPKLNHPSLALPLPNGYIVCNDDRNHRVIVINPRTNRILWQYGVTAKPGNGPGRLNNPDGVDLAPPYSLMTDRPSPAGTQGSLTSPTVSSQNRGAK